MVLEVSFYISLVLCTLLLYILVQLGQLKNKRSVHYTFMGNIFFIFVWVAGICIEYKFFLDRMDEFFFIQFIGSSLAPPLFLLSTYLYSKTDKALSKKHLLLFIIPMLTIILSATNSYHHLFAKSFSIYIDQSTPHLFGIISIIYSYSCIAIGLLYLIYFSVNNVGIFSKQALLILSGAFIPVFIQMLIVINRVPVSWFVVPLQLSITCFFTWYAMTRYNFLRVVPIAMHHIINQIQDGFIVITKDNIWVDSNRSFEKLFGKIVHSRKNDNILMLFQDLGLVEDDIFNLITEAIANKHIIVFEKKIKIDLYDKYFNIEINPIFSSKQHIGTIMLFKDITQMQENIKKLELMNEALDHANIELQRQNEEILHFNECLKQMAETDPLTGAYNRRFFNEYYEIEIVRAKNNRDFLIEDTAQMDFAIAILDIDNFKHINDTLGHLAGDAVLKQVVDIIKKCIFSRDIVCRYGGEEFAIIYTKTTQKSSIYAAEKIRKEIEKHDFYTDESTKNIHLTVSIGLAVFDEIYSSENKDILKIADERLYVAKKSGKNLVVYQ